MAIKDIIWWGRWRKIVMVLYGIGMLYDFIGSQFLLNENLPAFRYLVPDLGWHWLTIGMGILLIITWEGVYRLRKLNASGNLILDYEAREGNLPVLPRELHEIFPQYTLGQPISRGLEAITPSAQFLRRLSYNQTLVEFLFSLLAWQKKDPRTYVAGSMSIPIVWSGQNPKEWAKDFVSHWQNIINDERRNK